MAMNNPLKNNKVEVRCFIQNNKGNTTLPEAQILSGFINAEELGDYMAKANKIAQQHNAIYLRFEVAYPDKSFIASLN